MSAILTRDAKGGEGSLRLTHLPNPQGSLCSRLEGRRCVQEQWETEAVQPGDKSQDAWA